MTTTVMLTATTTTNYNNYDDDNGSNNGGHNAAWSLTQSLTWSCVFHRPRPCPQLGRNHDYNCNKDDHNHDKERMTTTMTTVMRMTATVTRTILMDNHNHNHLGMNVGHWWWMAGDLEQLNRRRLVGIVRWSRKNIPTIMHHVTAWLVFFSSEPTCLQPGYKPFKLQVLISWCSEYLYEPPRMLLPTPTNHYHSNRKDSEETKITATTTDNKWPRSDKTRIKMLATALAAWVPLLLYFLYNL
jgi:hypothetical protein